jgi:glycosyltransferase involved in cell wall biosynthesis
MKIVINTIPLFSPLTGIGNYIFNLSTQLRNLRPDYDYFYYYGYYSRKLRLNGEGNNLFYRTKEIVKKIPVASSVTRKLKNSLAHLQLRRYDIYFEPNFIPLDIRARKVVTTVHDFSFYHHPEWHPRDRIEYFSDNFFKRIDKSDVIITISEYVRKEAIEILKGYGGKIISIPLGYDQALFNIQNEIKIEHQLPERFVLFVGSVEPRKNLRRLLEAYMQLPDRVKKDYKLLIAGFKGWKNKDIMELLKRAEGCVEYLGYVSNEMLADLYRSASCFVYPSLYEGFGLPPLEAMACGCPVVVSNVASLPEVCGDAAYYVDPYSVESIAEGMYKVLTDDTLRQNLIKKGLERAKLFSWEKSAREHLKVFEEVLNS